MKWGWIHELMLQPKPTFGLKATYYVTQPDAKRDSLELWYHKLCTTKGHTHVNSILHALINTTKPRSVWYLIYFCRCVIADLLMQHKFCCVHLVNKIWGKWKTNQIPPTYLVSIEYERFHHQSWMHELIMAVSNDVKGIASGTIHG